MSLQRVFQPTVYASLALFSIVLVWAQAVSTIPFESFHSPVDILSLLLGVFLAIAALIAADAPNTRAEDSRRLKGIAAVVFVLASAEFVLAAGNNDLWCDIPISMLWLVFGFGLLRTQPAPGFHRDSFLIGLGFQSIEFARSVLVTFAFPYLLTSLELQWAESAVDLLVRGCFIVGLLAFSPPFKRIVHALNLDTRAVRGQSERLWKGPSVFRRLCIYPLQQSANVARFIGVAASSLRNALDSTARLRDPHKSRAAVRKMIARVSEMLPRSTSVRIERFVRGWEEYNELRDADFVVASYAKSGRTWLRVLISHYYHLRYDLPDSAPLVENANLHRLDKRIPRIMFTHDNYLSDYVGRGNKDHFKDKKVILLVRHPVDTAVSCFFHYKYRSEDRKRTIISVNVPDDDAPSARFMLDPIIGIPPVVQFLNAWARSGNMDKAHLIKYEDLARHTQGTLLKVLKFLGEDPTVEELEKCTAYGSFENMRALEAKSATGRLKPADPNRPDSFKVRRGKAIGYVDYFSADELKVIDDELTCTLSPVFGYTTRSEAAKTDVDRA